MKVVLVCAFISTLTFCWSFPATHHETPLPDVWETTPSEFISVVDVLDIVKSLKEAFDELKEKIRLGEIKNDARSLLEKLKSLVESKIAVAKPLVAEALRKVKAAIDDVIASGSLKGCFEKLLQAAVKRLEEIKDKLQGYGLSEDLVQTVIKPAVGQCILHLIPILDDDDAYSLEHPDALTSAEVYAYDESSHCINCVNSINSINAINSVNSLNAINAVNSLNAINAVNSMNAINAANSLNALNAVNSMNAINSINSLNAINSINSMNAINKVNGRSDDKSSSVAALAAAGRVVEFKVVDFLKDIVEKIEAEMKKVEPELKAVLEKVKSIIQNIHDEVVAGIEKGESSAIKIVVDVIKKLGSLKDIFESADTVAVRFLVLPELTRVGDVLISELEKELKNVFKDEPSSHYGLTSIRSVNDVAKTVLRFLNDVKDALHSGAGKEYVLNALEDLKITIDAKGAEANGSVAEVSKTISEGISTAIQSLDDVEAPTPSQITEVTQQFVKCFVKAIGGH